MRTAFTFVLLALLHLSTVRAEIAVGFTAEWLSHESKLVALATPLDVQTIETSDHVRFTKCRYRLDDIIKGPQSVGDTVTVFEASRSKPDALSLDKARKAGTQLLVFATVAENLHKEIDGKYVLIPIVGSNTGSAYFADQSVDNLYTQNFKTLVKFDELLLRTRAQAVYESELKRRFKQGEFRKKTLEVSLDSEAHKKLYAGSVCYLWVPEFKQ
jgi:hypothetical protein